MPKTSREHSSNNTFSNSSSVISLTNQKFHDEWNRISDLQSKIFSKNGLDLKDLTFLEDKLKTPVQYSFIEEPIEQKSNIDTLKEHLKSLGSLQRNLNSEQFDSGTLSNENFNLMNQDKLTFGVNENNLASIFETFKRNDQYQYKQITSSAESSIKGLDYYGNQIKEQTKTERYGGELP
jgi:hypothetical protein